MMIEQEIISKLLNIKTNMLKYFLRESILLFRTPKHITQDKQYTKKYKPYA